MRMFYEACRPVMAALLWSLADFHMEGKERVPRRGIACSHVIERRVTTTSEQFFTEDVAMVRKDVSFLMSAIPGPDAVEAEPPADGPCPRCRSAGRT